MKKIKFEQAVNEYLHISKLKLKPNSYRSMENRIKNNILPYFQKKYIHKIDKREYIKWQLEIDKKDYSIRYKKNLHVCFVSFLNYCIKYYDLKVNVAQQVGNFKSSNYEVVGDIWEFDEFNKFISCVDDKVYNTFFKLLFYTGVRLGEALALTYEDIDIINNTIRINKNMTRFVNEKGEHIIVPPKTKKSIREIGIDNVMKNELLELNKYYSKNYDICNNKFYIFGGNKPLAPTTIERKKNKYCDLANVKRIKIHEFRHSHACLLFMNNVPISEISQRLGHSSISMTTDIYLRFLPRQEKRVLATLNSLRLSA